MEKAFKLVIGSDIFEAWRSYFENRKFNRLAIDKFFEEKGIEANAFYTGGSGFVNKPFDEDEKREITLGIIPTELDLEVYGKQLRMPDKNGLRMFRKGSAILREFQDYCIQEKMIVNIMQPDMRDYFRSMEWSGYKRHIIPYQDTYLIKIESEYLSNDDVPEGFEEIKLSEFYAHLEQLEKESGE